MLSFQVFFYFSLSFVYGRNSQKKPVAGNASVNMPPSTRVSSILVYTNEYLSVRRTFSTSSRFSFSCDKVADACVSIGWVKISCVKHAAIKQSCAKRFRFFLCWVDKHQIRKVVSHREKRSLFAIGFFRFLLIIPFPRCQKICVYPIYLSVEIGY